MLNHEMQLTKIITWTLHDPKMILSFTKSYAHFTTKCIYHTWNVHFVGETHFVTQNAKNKLILWTKCISWSTKSFILVCVSLKKHSVHEMCILWEKCISWHFMTFCSTTTKKFFGVFFFFVYKIKNTFTLTCTKCKTFYTKLVLGLKFCAQN